MPRILHMIFSIFILFSIASCGSESGTGGSSSSFNFVRWSAISPPTTVNLEGVSQSTSYSSTNSIVTGVGTPSSASENSSASIKYRTNGTIERISVSTPTTSVSWNESNGETIDDTEIVIFGYNDDFSKIGTVLDPVHPALDWNYQTFGVWLTGYRKGGGNIGAISVGSPTPGSAVNTTGSATFVGITTGVYINSSGSNQYLTVGDLTANVNFSDRSVGITTTGTSKTSLVTGSQTIDSGLNMTGTLKYAPNNSSFNGSLTTNGGMSGTSNGRFYGPNTQELGGVFFLRGTGLETYGGGYGAKRQ